MSRDCRSLISCSLCNSRHHTSLCKGRGSTSQSVGNHVPPTNPSTQSSNIPAIQPPLTSQVHTPSTTTGLYCVNADTPVLLQTAQAYIYKPNNPACGMTIRLMFDGGSQRSYVTERVKETLGLETGRTEVVNLRTFGSETTRTQTVELVTAAIMPKEGSHIHVLFSTVPLICEPLSCQPVAYTKQHYSHLADLELADFSRISDELQIDALIGSDHYWQLVTGQIIQGHSGPTAIHTRLGWVLSGPVCSGTELNNSYPSSHAMLIQSLDTPCLENLLKNFWELESLGINPDEPSVYEEFKKSVKFVGGRYEVSLPWRPNWTQLPSNLHLATKRLQGLLKRLRQHPDVRTEYHAIMQEQLRQGIIEKVQPCQTGDRIHYLPHHAVIRKDKQTTKLRIVYDASARDKGLSLNDCLFSGPKFNQCILDILIRFRTYRIAFVADVEKAFLMVSVREEDRNALRFLWVDDVKKPSPIIQEMRFTRVVFGVSSSPFLLNATISHHLHKYHDRHPHLVETLLHSIYVDDVTCGADTED